MPSHCAGPRSTRARRWTRCSRSTPAGNWTDFRAAAAQFEVPAQNMVYADVDGNIGYQSPGRIPVRTHGDGRWPAPGWDSSYDWSRLHPVS